MSGTTATRLLPLREIAVIGLVTVALFLVLAISSYSPTDPGFSYSSASSDTHNLFGTLGAYFADLSLYLFGWIAYLLPISLVLIGIRLIL